jgi:trans-aconitate 2-methyltransferase
VGISASESAREWNSKVYHRVSNPQFGWGLKVLERLILRGDERAMDAGCGTGRLTEKLLERLPRGSVVGVDQSHNMLRQAAEHLDSTDGRARFVQADLVRLPFEKDFDVVFSTATFHWVLDHEALFKSLARALKSGGKIEAQCGGLGNLQKVHARTVALMKSDRFARFFSNWREPWEFASAETTAERLRHAGFVEIKTWLEPAGFRLNSADEYRDFLGSVILRPFLTAISEIQLRDEFLEEMVRQAMSDPSFELDYWRLNLQAQRA